MGSCFNYTVFDGILTESQLKTEFSDYKDEQGHQHGHGAYSGTLATTRGLEVERKCFPTEYEAHQYIMDNTNKWGNALAVQFNDKKKVTEKEPTFNGRNAAEAAGEWLCLRQTWRPKNETVAADQLTAAQKERILKAYEAFDKARNEETTLRQEQFRLVGRLQKIDEDFTAEDFSLLKKNRTALRKAAASLAKHKQNTTKIDRELGEKLYKHHTEETGRKWIVGGWCAE